MRLGRPTKLPHYVPIQFRSPLIVSELTLISNLEASAASAANLASQVYSCVAFKVSLTTEKCHEKPVESLHRNPGQSLPSPVYFAISQKYLPFQPQQPNCSPRVVMPIKGALQWSEHVLAAMYTYVCECPLVDTST